MKSKKNAIKIAVAIIVICFPVYTILQFRLYTDSFRNFLIDILSIQNHTDLRDYVMVICSGAMGSAIVSLIILISEYNTQKLETLENLFIVSMEFISAFRNLDYLVIREPIELVQQFYFEKENNNLNNHFNEQMRRKVLDEECPSDYEGLYSKHYRPLKQDAKNELIKWMGEHRDEKNSTKEDLEKILNDTIEKYDENIEKIIKQYIELRKIKSISINGAMGKIDFILSNKRIREKFIFEKIFHKQIYTLKFVQKESWHFEEYLKNNNGNISVMLDIIFKIQKEIFEVEEKEGRYLVYRKFCMEMDNELENLRKLMYKKKYIKDEQNRKEYLFITY